MVSDILSSLLLELGQALQLEELQPDRNQSCLIHFPNGIDIQIEMDKTGTFLIVGTLIAEVPSGRYRENIYREALRANGQINSRVGIFAHSNLSNKLVLFKFFSLQMLTGDRIADFIRLMLEKAQHWKESIQRGELPTVVTESSGSASSSVGLFGLRP